MGAFQGASTGLSFSNSLTGAKNVTSGGGTIDPVTLAAGKPNKSFGSSLPQLPDVPQLSQSFNSIGAMGSNPYGLDAFEFKNRYYGGGNGPILGRVFDFDIPHSMKYFE